MIAEVSAGFSILRTATELAKIVHDSGLSLKQAEYKLKMAELIEKLAAAKIAIQAEIENKNEIIRDLEERLRISALLSYESPYYWMVDGGHRQGPYCQQCYDSAGKIVRLQPRHNLSGLWDCKACKNYYKDSSYSPQVLRVLPRRSSWRS